MVTRLARGHGEEQTATGTENAASSASASAAPPGLSSATPYTELSAPTCSSAETSSTWSNAPLLEGKRANISAHALDAEARHVPRIDADEPLDLRANQSGRYAGSAKA